MFLFRGSLYLYDVVEAYISMTLQKLMSLWRQLSNMSLWRVSAKLWRKLRRNYDENCINWNRLTVTSNSAIMIRRPWSDDPAIRRSGDPTIRRSDDLDPTSIRQSRLRLSARLSRSSEVAFYEVAFYEVAFYELRCLIWSRRGLAISDRPVFMTTAIFSML